MSAAAADREHLVRFYRDDASLASQVSPFLGGGLGAGGAAAIICEPGHRLLFEGRLRELGLDLKALKAAGRFESLDARETLAWFMRGGRPDRALFMDSVGALVRRLSAQGRGLRAYGEMVAVLEKDGHLEAAIALEGLWNELLVERPFSLYCAYPLERIDALAAGGRESICRTHTHVLPEPPAGKSPLASALEHAGALRSEVLEARRSAAELRRTRDQLTTLMETASVPLHWVGPDGVVLWANQASLDLLGRTAAEHVGHSILPVFAEPGLPAAFFARLQRGEALRGVEARVRRKDGSVRTILIDSSVYREEGRFIHSQCFWRDVTDERAAAEAARRLAAIVESSEDAIYSHGLDGVILTWNRSARRLFGYEEAEAVGKSVSLLIPERLVGEDARLQAKVASGGRVEQFETLRRRKDGSFVRVSLTVSPIFDAQGRIAGISKIVRDITDRLYAQEETRRLAEIIESSETAIVGVDLQGRINAWNRGAEKLFGYTKGEAMARPLSLIAPPERREEPLTVLARVRRGESIPPYEAVRMSKDGRELQVAIKVSPVRGADGGIIGAAGVFRDITAEKRSRAALKAAQDALARSYEELERRTGE